MYVLDASHISKGYESAGETIEVLRDVSLQIARGEMFAIMGPSGSGVVLLFRICFNKPVHLVSRIHIVDKKLFKC